jgi:hypothetical protein
MKRSDDDGDEEFEFVAGNNSRTVGLQCFSNLFSYSGLNIFPICIVLWDVNELRCRNR